jgi:hypothetical protein
MKKLFTLLFIIIVNLLLNTQNIWGQVNSPYFFDFSQTLPDTAHFTFTSCSQNTSLASCTGSTGGIQFTSTAGYFTFDVNSVTTLYYTVYNPKSSAYYFNVYNNINDTVSIGTIPASKSGCSTGSISLNIDSTVTLRIKPYGNSSICVMQLGIDASGPVGIKTSDLNAPLTFSLNQNYPNPFNPQTLIGYTLQVASKTILKVYNVLGEEIATLVNEVQQAGSHSVNFNAGNLASGVYFYKLTAGSYVQTKKMILLK